MKRQEVQINTAGKDRGSGKRLGRSGCGFASTIQCTRNAEAHSELAGSVVIFSAVPTAVLAMLLYLLFRPPLVAVLVMGPL